YHPEVLFQPQPPYIGIAVGDGRQLVVPGQLLQQGLAVGKEGQCMARLEEHLEPGQGQFAGLLRAVAGLAQTMLQHRNAQGGYPVTQFGVDRQHLSTQGATRLRVELSGETGRMAVQPLQQGLLGGGYYRLGFPQGIVQIEGQQLDHGADQSLVRRLARGCALSYTSARCWKFRRVYTWVVRISLWPSSSCTARRSPEDSSRGLGKEWRSMCGCRCWPSCSMP